MIINGKSEDQITDWSKVKNYYVDYEIKYLM